MLKTKRREWGAPPPKCRKTKQRRCEEEKKTLEAQSRRRTKSAKRAQNEPSSLTFIGRWCLVSNKFPYYCTFIGITSRFDLDLFHQ